MSSLFLRSTPQGSRNSRYGCTGSYYTRHQGPCSRNLPRPHGSKEQRSPFPSGDDLNLIKQCLLPISQRKFSPRPQRLCGGGDGTRCGEIQPFDSVVSRHQSSYFLPCFPFACAEKLALRLLYRYTLIRFYTWTGLDGRFCGILRRNTGMALCLCSPGFAVPHSVLCTSSHTGRSDGEDVASCRV